jgi:hypothetical protein
MTVRFKGELTKFVRASDINNLLDLIEENLEPHVSKASKAIIDRIAALEAEVKRLNADLDTERRLRLASGGRKTR